MKSSSHDAIHAPLAPKPERIACPSCGQIMAFTKTGTDIHVVQCGCGAYVLASNHEAFVMGYI